MILTPRHRARLRSRARTLRSAATFGLDADAPTRAHADRLARVRAATKQLHTLLASGEVALVTGPSGGGKSTLLTHLAARCRCEIVDERAVSRSRVPVAEMSRLPLKEWLSLLARFGLADARVLLQKPCELSAGQRARLSLALTASRCSIRRGVERVTLVCDEFGSLLDRATALTLAHALGAWARRQVHVRVVVATAHEDVARELKPTVTVRVEERAITVHRVGQVSNLSAPSDSL